ncbi:MAG: UvrD-helicase domain-containing protein [Bacteroidota bacterium]|nr:UvrD-helicase domain-containing protein [Bacteroidota bacterium]
MNLTKEQEDIINSTGNIKINAVAGSGKTTTIIEYARTRPKESKILYLAFNKSVKLEAIKKFEDQGLDNVKVETAHSLAYKNIVFKNRYRVRVQGYKTNEIAEILNLKGAGDGSVEYVIANHINQFVTCFCNSDEQKVEDISYLDVISDKKTKSFVMSCYDYIKEQSNIFLKLMDGGKIEVTHDFYLKKFHLSNPKLNYDYILFDEAQDASPAMLDVFLKQRATKVIVGDTHQQIYGWRFAVNSLQQADFKVFHLSTSFRFSQDIADLAMEILKFKNYDERPTIPIVGKGNYSGYKTKAVIARTNLGLLLKAIEYVVEKSNIRNIYFEGNINSYTYADEGASLYDVLNLYNGKRHLIKDKLIKAMKNINDLEKYIKNTADVQLKMMLDIVKEYGNEIPGIIKQIKDRHVENNEKEKAEMIFSTVHRCKGMEYDAIQLVNDFIPEEKLTKSKKQEGLNSAKLNEEINLLYVAVTRTKNSIHIPEPLMPKGFPKSPQIHVMNVTGNEVEEPHTDDPVVSGKEGEKKEKAYSVEEVRTRHQDAYKPWTSELDNELTRMHCEGINTRDMAKHFGRTKGAIRSRVKKLQLEEVAGAQ